MNKGRIPIIKYSEFAEATVFREVVINFYYEIFTKALSLNNLSFFVSGLQQSVW